MCPGRWRIKEKPDSSGVAAEGTQGQSHPSVATASGACVKHLAEPSRGPTRALQGQPEVMTTGEDLGAQTY